MTTNQDKISLLSVELNELEDLEETVRTRLTAEGKDADDLSKETESILIRKQEIKRRMFRLGHRRVHQEIVTVT